MPINGRPVRIELSTDDGGRRGGPGGGPGRIPFGRRDQSPPRAGGFARDQGPDYSQLPAGVDLPPGEKATDAISKTLAQVNPGMMQDVMSDMKVGYLTPTTLVLALSMT